MNKHALYLLYIGLLIMHGGVAECLAQDQDTPGPHISYQGSDTVLVVYYIGAASCNFSTRPEVIDAAKTIPEGFRQAHDRPVKFVFASMDRDIEEGLEFMRKHGEGWDEISIGARYNNETLLRNFNSKVTPGTPHVIVYEDVYSIDELNIPHLENREKVLNVFGADGVVRWVEESFPLEQ